MEAIDIYIFGHLGAAKTSCKHKANVIAFKFLWQMYEQHTSFFLHI